MLRQLRGVIVIKQHAMATIEDLSGKKQNGHIHAGNHENDCHDEKDHQTRCFLAGMILLFEEIHSETFTACRSEASSSVNSCASLKPNAGAIRLSGNICLAVL